MTPHAAASPVLPPPFRQVNAAVYMWPMVAFATAILLNLLSMAFEKRPVKRQLCFLAVYISGVAFVYEFLAWKRAAPIYITAAGRPISLLRWGPPRRCRWRRCQR